MGTVSFFWNFKWRKAVAFGAHYLLCTFLFRFFFRLRQLFLAFGSWVRICIVQITYQLLEAGKQAGGRRFEPSANVTNQVRMECLYAAVHLVSSDVDVHIVYLLTYGIPTFTPFHTASRNLILGFHLARALSGSRALPFYLDSTLLYHMLLHDEVGDILSLRQRAHDLKTTAEREACELTCKTVSPKQYTSP